MIADAGSDLAGIAKSSKAADKLGAGVLILAPVGGVLSGVGQGRTQLSVDRTALTPRPSIEFDTLAAALGLHRAWDRSEMVMASQAPPATESRTGAGAPRPASPGHSFTRQ